MTRLTECLLTYSTFVRFLSAVNSAVLSKGSSLCKSFTTNGTFKRFLSQMNSSMNCYLVIVYKAFSHSLHLYLLPCIFKCILKYFAVWNRFPHTEQTYELRSVGSWTWPDKSLFLPNPWTNSTTCLSTSVINFTPYSWQTECLVPTSGNR